MAHAIRDAYLWACERLYHEFAWSYDAVSRAVSLGQWPAWRRMVLAEVRGDAVLEIGFGTGELLAEMAMRPWHTFGLERSPAMQAIAAHRLAGYPTSIPCVQATALAMPFAAGAFDTIVSTFPAPYILAEATLCECVRVLRPGGRLVIGGLWVEPQRSLNGLLPVFYGKPSAALVAAIEDEVAGAGFDVQWRPHVTRSVAIPVLVAEKARGGV